MAKLFVDLKKMKKVKDDGKTAVFEHEAGHKFEVKHSSLSPGMREQLSALKLHKGGKTTDKAGPALSMLRDKQGGTNNPKLAESKKEPQKMAEGGAVGYPPCKNPSCPSHGQPHPNCRCYGMAEGGMAGIHKDQCPYSVCQRFADGGFAGNQEPGVQDLIPPQETPIPPSHTMSDAFNGLHDTPGEPTNTPTAPQDAPQAPSPQPTGGAPQGAPPTASEGQPGAPEQSDPFGTKTQRAMQNAAYENLTAGAGNQQLADRIKGQAEFDAAAGQAESQKNIQAAYQKNFKEMSDQFNAVAQDALDTHINPNHYLESLSTAGKISTAIGLIAGGIGGGNGANPAQEFLHQQIDRDVDAQKNALGNKHTILSAYLHQFGNLRDATDMARLSQASIYAAKLQQAAALSTDPQAVARYQNSIGMLQKEFAPLMSQTAMRMSLLQGAKNGTVSPEHVIYGLVPKEQQPAAYKELKEAQDANRLRSDTLSAFDQIAKLSTLGSRLGSPIQSGRQIDELRGATLDKLTKDTSGRVTPETVKLVGSALSKMGNSEETIRKGRQVVDNLLSSNMHFPLLKTYGIDMEPKPAHPYEGKVIVNKTTGERRIIQNGVDVPYGRK